jgi:hypothetical protein
MQLFDKSSAVAQALSRAYLDLRHLPNMATHMRRRLLKRFPLWEIRLR